MEISSTSSLSSGMDLSLTHVLLIYVSLGNSGSLRMIKMPMLMVVLVVGQDKENVIKLYFLNKVRSTSSPLLTHKFIAGIISNWIYCTDIKKTVNPEERMIECKKEPTKQRKRDDKWRLCNYWLGAICSWILVLLQETICMWMMIARGPKLKSGMDTYQ